MRLINAHTLRLESFDDESTTPRYAILSHTWGSEEVTFNEFNSLSRAPRHVRTAIKAKAGFYKITKTCAQAMLDGFSYAWVDTCCIDKSSSSELSEAINSMFRWYKKAEVCYAYLDDIDIHDPYRTGDIGHARSNVKRYDAQSISLLSQEDLAGARWFTRGWTLQELIAPRKMAFYIKGWHCIGRKAVMIATLAHITGIDEETLRGSSREGVSVARRMSWAAKRVTTRQEDIAYCLLGIFDVNMPLLYGEGDKAFVRLQEEIMKNSDDQSLFAWSPLEAIGEDAVDLLSPINGNLGRSVFARHPIEFADSHRIRPCFSSGWPYELTNKGVRMQNLVHPLDNGYALVILECERDGEHAKDAPERIGIVVWEVNGQIPGTSRQYVRNHSAVLVTVSEAAIATAEPATVYICKKIPARRNNVIPWRDQWSLSSVKSFPSSGITEIGSSSSVKSFAAGEVSRMDEPVANIT